MMGSFKCWHDTDMTRVVKLFCITVRLKIVSPHVKSISRQTLMKLIDGTSIYGLKQETSVTLFLQNPSSD